MPYHIYVWSFTSGRVSASFHVTCVFFFHNHPSTSASDSLFQTAPSHASTLPASSSCVIERLPMLTSSSALIPFEFSRVFTLPSPRFLVTLFFYVALRVILMQTPFQRTSTLLVQCIPTPHKPWVRMAPLITSRCSVILALLLKLHILSLKTPVTSHLIFNQ